jgi:hypothetical protein
VLVAEQGPDVENITIDIGGKKAEIHIRHLSYNSAYDVQQAFTNPATGGVDKSKVKEYRVALLEHVITDAAGAPEPGMKEFLQGGRNKFFDSIEDQVLKALGLKGEPVKDAEKN